MGVLDHRPICRAGLTAVAVVLQMAATAAAQPDSDGARIFYLERLTDGKGSFARGEHREAARSFRLACFGLLEQPTLLTECVARLALAELAAGDQSEARDSLRRLVSLVDRFDRYDEASLSDAMRGDVETAALDLVPNELIEASPTFSLAARERRTAGARAMSGMSKRQKIEFLTARMEAEPEEPSWLVELADLRFADGHAEEAARLAADALELEPGHARARCLRGASRAAAGQQCRQALLDMAACPRTQSDPAFARGHLRCQIELDELGQALQFIGSLPAQTLGDAGVRRLARSARERAENRGVTELPAQAPASADELKQQPSERIDGQRNDDRGATEEADGAPTRMQPTTTAPSKPAIIAPSRQGQAATDSRLTTLERAALDRAHSLLQQAGSVRDLEEALASARSVADAHPEDKQAQYLVATIAYQASHFVTAVLYFERGGDPGLARADLLFYQAVALYESGYKTAAAATLRRCLSRLERSGVVERYAAAILGEN